MRTQAMHGRGAYLSVSLSLYLSFSFFINVNVQLITTRINTRITLQQHDLDAEMNAIVARTIRALENIDTNELDEYAKIRERERINAESAQSLTCIESSMVRIDARLQEIQAAIKAVETTC